MKHKGERNIPDFSKKPKAPAKGGAAAQNQNAPNAKPARAPQPKPQATSSKSGHRG
ncbi:MAG TPA: hypothetical protein VGM82_09685 [Gemmatimonadaceae bacterium]|jgi:hypothetical protein